MISNSAEEFFFTFQNEEYEFYTDTQLGPGQILILGRTTAELRSDDKK